MAQVHWRRSLRARRVSLRLDPRDGVVIVTLPSRTARNVGVALLNDNAAWVMQRLAALPTAVPFEDGATVSLAGGQYRIRHVGTAGASTRRGAVWLKDDEIHVAGDGAFQDAVVRVVFYDAQPLPRPDRQTQFRQEHGDM